MTEDELAEYIYKVLEDANLSVGEFGWYRDGLGFEVMEASGEKYYVEIIRARL